MYLNNSKTLDLHVAAIGKYHKIFYQEQSLQKCLIGLKSSFNKYIERCLILNDFYDATASKLFTLCGVKIYDILKFLRNVVNCNIAE